MLRCAEGARRNVDRVHCSNHALGIVACKLSESNRREARMRAKHRIGELSAGLETVQFESLPDVPNSERQSKTATLAAAGISKTEAHRCEKIAAIPEAVRLTALHNARSEQGCRSFRRHMIHPGTLSFRCRQEHIAHSVQAAPAVDSADSRQHTRRQESSDKNHRLRHMSRPGKEYKSR